jgi:hypothetical protein
MLRVGLTVALLIGALLPAPAAAQEDLSLVREVPWKEFRSHIRTLLESREAAGRPFPEETARAVRAVLDRAPGEVDLPVEVQKLLDVHCLLAVHINPESRVKAFRGPLRPVLRRDQPLAVLVKVHNEGGVTHPLQVEGAQLLGKETKDADRWLEASVYRNAPISKGLSGARVEYRVLKLLPRQSGKREATLIFDVGQGTQDLGFRAEVPVLFHVREP